MKNHPDITENIFTGMLRIKSSKQISFFLSKILRMCKGYICLQTEVFDELLLYFFYRTKVVGLMREVYV